MSNDAFRSAFLNQAESCRRLGSPFSAMVMEALASQLDPTTAAGRRIGEWPGNIGPSGASVPLRVAGALHALVRLGRANELALLYPPHPLPEQNVLLEPVSKTLATHDAWIARFLDSPPQTNEIGRSSLLYAGLIAITGFFKLPIVLLEIGSSAGLNLVPERYGYTFGNLQTGDLASPVQLAPTWTGPAPSGIKPAISARRGCDQNPIDVQHPESRERLLAYIWPDQPVRLSRTKAAIALLATNAPKIDRADAVDWVEAQIQSSPGNDQARVVMHSITMNYLTDTAKDRIRAAIETAGAAATDGAPLAWLSFEQEGRLAALRLRLWPHRIDRLLATADPHGSSVTWYGLETSTA